MFKNYLLLSLKVLRRKPFYTFVSLFGISFTLMVLLLITSLSDAMLGSNKPFSNLDDMLSVNTIVRKRIEKDSILKVDTLLSEGIHVLDSTYTYQTKTVSYASSPLGYRFIKDKLMTVENAEAIAIANGQGNVDGYLDGRKFSFSPAYVNAAYYDVFDFEFLHGDRLYEADIEQAEKVVVMTDKAAENYFGEVSAKVIGQEIELAGERFRVRGIVTRPLGFNVMTMGDIHLPVTTIDDREISGDDVAGGFTVTYLCKSDAQKQALREEIDFMAENFVFPPDDWHNDLAVRTATPREVLALEVTGEEDPALAKRQLLIPLAILLLLFITLPLINLINLSSGRVAERRAEIGVRKAFGATGRDILLQFIFENLVLTIIGSLFGVLLALGVIAYVNANDLLSIVQLSVQPWVFLYFVIAVFVFGFVSGILPAYRMSQTNVANSLR